MPLGCSGLSRQGLRANWGTKDGKGQGDRVDEGGANGVVVGFRQGWMRVGTK